MSYIQFESANNKERARKELREAREQMLEKAKKDAERRAERDAQKLLSGEKSWMLPAVASKFEKHSKSSKTIKKNKKSKKSKKSKILKKSINKKRKRKHSSSSSSSTDSDSESETSSSESNKGKISKSKKNKKKSQKEYSRSESDTSDEGFNKTDEWVEIPNIEPTIKRDNWMMDAGAFSLKTFSKERVDQKKNESNQSEKYDPTKSSRELNPHWKTTGTGLPAFQKPKDYSDDEGTNRRLPISTSNSNSWRKKSVQKVETVSKKTCDSTSSSSESESKQAKLVSKRFESTDFLTDQQMNELGAKILKAEILGNMELAEELKEKLEKARVQRTTMKDHKRENIQKTTKTTIKKDEHVLLTHTDTYGNSRPLQTGSGIETFDSRDLYGGKKGRRKTTKRTETHVDGERVRYFPDDDKYDIKQMFEREKYTTAADSNLQFAGIASKHKNPNDDLEDIFADKIRKNISETESNKKEIQRAINAHEKLTAQLEKCDKCFESEKMNKSLIISMGEKVYLALPWHIGLQTGHCLIIPTQHVSCSTQLDEDTWEEIENFRKALTRMFEAQKKDVIFFEIANKLHRRPHLSIHCIPVPFRDSEAAPFYFKKAIEESEHEWSVNKQLVRLRREKGLRACIPKGLPYFWVNFGIDSGMAHVIEDENRFPSNFALEIIGGMLQLDSNKWRKPQKEQNYINKVKIFADNWKKYDCTQ